MAGDPPALTLSPNGDMEQRGARRPGTHPGSVAPREATAVNASLHLTSRPIARRGLLGVAVAVLAVLLATPGAAASGLAAGPVRSNSTDSVRPGACLSAAAGAVAPAQVSCEAEVAQQVAIRAAWEWVLCWDEGEACEAQIARQRPSWEAWAWVRCVNAETGGAP